MKRTRAQNPKLQDPLDPSAAVAAAPNPKPQRRAKQPRQPKAPGKKTSSSSAAAAAATAAADAAAAAAAGSPAVSSGAEMVATVPDVCSGGGGGEELAAAEWEYQMDGGGLLGNGEGSWWTFGVEEEKLLGWFPFVEEDFFRCRGTDAEFDDDIWRIHQIYEIPSYAAK